MKLNLCIALLPLLFAGCATTVVPAQRPADPVAVFIADYGVHSSLLLPVDQGRYVEYAFGDWGYAAENHEGPHDAVGALLISSHSAFGRRYITTLDSARAPSPLHPAPKKLSRIVVSGADVRRLLIELDDRYRRGLSPSVHNPENNVDYVMDSEHYSIANNCNHLTAESLRKLGCEIHGWVGTSKFYVAPTPNVEVVDHHALLQAGTMPSAKAE